MSRAPDAAALLISGTLRGVVFTDLDGTLLDFDTFSPSAAAIATVRDLLAFGVMTVPVTSKTVSEIEDLATRMPLAPIAAAEGGAVLREKGREPRLLGVPRRGLIGVLQTLQAEGWPIRGLSEMSVAEVEEVTGLSRGASRRALDRLASEPFVFVSQQAPGGTDLRQRVTELGGNLVQGGRLWHLLGAGVDKGGAVEAVRTCLPLVGSVPSAAVGDAWNDLDMLRRTEHRFLLGPSVPDRQLPPGVERISERGPAGFVEAMARFRSRLEAC